MTDFDSLSAELRSGRLLRSETELLSYSYDGALERARPDAVVLVRDADEIRRAVSWCASRGVPFTARGAGTNLCGAAIPLRGGVVLALAPLNRIHEIDTAGGTAIVEPGVVNLQLQKELERLGRFYAPDPASFRVCTLGGNVAQNAGGPRCLKYGVTTDHVLAVEAVLPDGSVERFAADDPGPDLLGLLVGAEGTLGVVTRMWLKTLPSPKTIVTILAGFPSIERSIECVSDIIASGVLPRVLEAMDRVTVESIEAYCRAGYPKTEAVLLIELDGPSEAALAEAEAVERRLKANGAIEIRRAREAAERDRLWEGRRGAYAAVARIAPNVSVEDGVVPRGRLPEAVRRLRKISSDLDIVMPLLFHAGDGNLHPNVAYDERDAAETERVKRAGHEVLRACVELEGSISGEHGIGADKRRAMAWLFSPETLALFRRIRDAFDPGRLSNPEKLIPSEREAEPGIAPRRPLSAAAQKLVSDLKQAAEKGESVSIVGAGTRRDGAASGHVVLRTAGLDRIVDLDAANYTVTVEAGITLAELAKRLKEADGPPFHLPVEPGPGTLGGAIASKACLELRDVVIGMRVALASGEVVELGGKVVKNVAGYDAGKLFFGSWGTFGVILEVTLKLASSQELAWRMKRASSRRTSSAGFVPNRWHRALKGAFDPQNRLEPKVFA